MSANPIKTAPRQGFASSPSSLVVTQFVVPRPKNTPNSVLTQLINYLKNSSTDTDDTKQKASALIQFAQSPLFGIMVGMGMIGGVSVTQDLIPWLASPKALTEDQSKFVDLVLHPERIDLGEVKGIMRVARQRLEKDYDPFADKEIGPLLEKHYLSLFPTREQKKSAREEFTKLFKAYNIRVAMGVLPRILSDCDGPYAFKNLLQPEDAANRASNLLFALKILTVSASARLDRGLKLLDRETVDEAISLAEVADQAIKSGYYPTNGSAEMEKLVKDYFQDFDKAAFSLKPSEIEKIQNPALRYVLEQIRSASPVIIVTARAGIHTTTSRSHHPSGVSESAIEGSAYAETGLPALDHPLGEYIGVLGVGGLIRHGDKYQVSKSLMQNARIFRELLKRFPHFTQSIQDLSPRATVPKGVSNAALILEEAEKAVEQKHGERYKFVYSFKANWFDERICGALEEVAAKINAGIWTYEQGRSFLYSQFRPLDPDRDIEYNDSLKLAQLKDFQGEGAYPIHKEAFELIESAHFGEEEFKKLNVELRAMLTNDVVYHTIRDSLQVLDPNDPQGRTEPDKEQAVKLLHDLFQTPEGMAFREWVNHEYNRSYKDGVRADKGYPEGRQINPDLKEDHVIFNTVNNSKRLFPAETTNLINKFFVLHQASYSELVAGKLEKTASIVMERLKNLAPFWFGDSPSDQNAGGENLVSHPLATTCNVRNLVSPEEYRQTIFEKLEITGLEEKLEDSARSLKQDLERIHGKDSPQVDQLVQEYQDIVSRQILSHPLAYKTTKSTDGKKVLSVEIVGGNNTSNIRGKTFSSPKELFAFLTASEHNYLETFFGERIYREPDTEHNMMALAVATGLSAGYDAQALDHMLQNPALALDKIAPGRYTFQLGGRFTDLDMPPEFRFDTLGESRNVYHPLHAAWLKAPIVSQRIVAGGALLAALGSIDLVAGFIKHHVFDKHQVATPAGQIDGKTPETSDEQAKKDDDLYHKIEHTGHNLASDGFMFMNLGYLIRNILCDSTPQPLSIIGNLIGMGSSLIPSGPLQNASILASLAANIGGWFNRYVLWGQTEVYKPKDHNALIDQLQYVEKDLLAAKAKNADGTTYLDGKLNAIPAYEYTHLQMKRNEMFQGLTEKGLPRPIADTMASIGQIFYATHRVLTKPGLLHDSLFVWHEKTDIVRGNPIIKPHIDGLGLAPASALPILALIALGLTNLTQRLLRKDESKTKDEASPQESQLGIGGMPEIIQSPEGIVQVRLSQKSKKLKKDEDDKTQSSATTTSNAWNPTLVASAVFSAIPAIAMIPTSWIIKQDSYGDPRTANLLGTDRQVRGMPITNSRMIFHGGLTSAACSILSLVPGVGPLFASLFPLAEGVRAWGLSNYQMMWYGQAHDNAAQFGGFRISDPMKHMEQLIEAHQKGYLKHWHNGKQLTAHVEKLLATRSPISPVTPVSQVSPFSRPARSLVPA